MHVCLESWKAGCVSRGWYARHKHWCDSGDKAWVVIRSGAMYVEFVEAVTYLSHHLLGECLELSCNQGAAVDMVIRIV